MRAHDINVGEHYAIILNGRRHVCTVIASRQGGNSRYSRYWFTTDVYEHQYPASYFKPLTAAEMAAVQSDECKKHASPRSYVDELGHEHGKACQVCGAADLYSHTPECVAEQLKAVQP